MIRLHGSLFGGGFGVDTVRLCEHAGVNGQVNTAVDAPAGCARVHVCVNAWKSGVLVWAEFSDRDVRGLAVPIAPSLCNFHVYNGVMIYVSSCFLA